MGVALLQEDLFASLQSYNMEQLLDNYIHNPKENNWIHLIRYHLISTSDIV